jgi:hypothetical protein
MFKPLACSPLITILTRLGLLAHNTKARLDRKDRLRRRVNETAKPLRELLGRREGGKAALGALGVSPIPTFVTTEAEWELADKCQEAFDGACNLVATRIGKSCDAVRRAVLNTAFVDEADA